MSKPKLLLHVCCAPCLSGVLPRLVDNYDVTTFFYNPNITDPAEYNLRRQELLRYLTEFNKEFSLDVSAILSDLNSAEFYAVAHGLESIPEGGKRCEQCFALRLGATCRVAQEQGFDLFATTLTLSPYKNAPLINRIGTALSQTDTKYLESDFKKKDGYKLSIELSKKYNLYRQNYCGCEYSKRD